MNSIFSATLISDYHVQYYAQATKKENDKKRMLELQPIFSIEIEKTDTALAGYAEFTVLTYQSSTPSHKNFTLKIENVGAYPVKNDKAPENHH